MNLTDRSQHVLEIAEREARQRAATEVLPEHPLLGLALEGHDAAEHVLRNLDVTAERIADALPRGTNLATDAAALPWASSTSRGIAAAHDRAGLWTQNLIDTEPLQFRNETLTTEL